MKRRQATGAVRDIRDIRPWATSAPEAVSAPEQQAAALFRQARVPVRFDPAAVARRAQSRSPMPARSGARLRRVAVVALALLLAGSAAVAATGGLAPLRKWLVERTPGAAARVAPAHRRARSMPARRVPARAAETPDPGVADLAAVDPAVADPVVAAPVVAAPVVAAPGVAVPAVAAQSAAAPAVAAPGDAVAAVTTPVVAAQAAAAVPPVAAHLRAPVRAPARRRLALSLPRGVRTTVPGATAPDSALARETRGLAPALVALRQRRDPTDALGKLESYLESFPDGMLRREAEMARVEALLLLDRQGEALAGLDGLALGSRTGKDLELRLARAELRAPTDCRAALADFAVVIASAKLPVRLKDRALSGQAACQARLESARLRGRGQ